MKVWRLGHRKNPCDFIPRRLCKWHHRFDDPRKLYRTLYCSERAITCLRELLADLRPNTKAIKEFEELFSARPEESLTIAGVVSAEWREQHVLIQTQVQFIQGRFISIEHPAVRKRLQEAYLPLLQQYGIASLDIAQVRSRQRMVTQTLSRALYEEGHAGIGFRSRLDRYPCFALFENRARLRPMSIAISMAENHPDLIQVCGEYTLVLRPA